MAVETGKVLVVDDEENVRFLLQRILEGAGYSVATASNGQEGIDLASQMDFEIVLLDINMPVLSGTEVLKWLSENKPQACAIMVTAIADIGSGVDAMKMGAYDYIVKPFNKDDVLNKIQNALQYKRIEMEDDRYRRNLESKVAEQSQQLQAQFAELVETLSREHKLLYEAAERQPGGIQAFFKRLPKELQKPMASSGEYTQAVLKILRREAAKSAYQPPPDTDKSK